MNKNIMLIIFFCKLNIWYLIFFISLVCNTQNFIFDIIKNFKFKFFYFFVQFFFHSINNLRIFCRGWYYSTRYFRSVDFFEDFFTFLYRIFIFSFVLSSVIKNKLKFFSTNTKWIEYWDSTVIIIFTHIFIHISYLHIWILK